MADCEMLPKCAFFNKHARENPLVCEGLARLYCRGNLQDDCERKRVRMATGQPPPDDMLPNGLKFVGLST